MSERGRPLVLSVDLGTSAVKVGLFTLGGHPHAIARRAYPTAERTGGSAEQDPEWWWAATCEALHEVLATTPLGPIRAVCVGGQGPTLVLTDGDGNATAAALTWQDRRPNQQIEALVLNSGTRLASYSLVPRLSWALTYKRAAVTRAHWAFQAWDFIAFRLGGGQNPVASRLRGDCVWRADWIEPLGDILKSLLPPEIDAGVAYAVTGGPWSREAGLPDGIPIVAGMNDGIGALLGSNATRVGRAIDTGGASGGLAVCWDSPIESPGIQAWPGLRPSSWIVGGALGTSGRALDWWSAAGNTASVSTTLLLAADSPPGANGVVFLPFLAGERAPLWDDDVRGAFVGLALQHTSSDLARAVLEGSALALRLLLDAVISAGAKVDELRVSGGPAASQLWNQAKADITGLPVAVPMVTESALLGNAICAAVGAGVHPDLLAGAAAMVHVAKTLTPRTSTQPTYQSRFTSYKAAYNALSTLPPAIL